MSSPISFSGFNNIDFNSIVNALMQQASQPLTTLQANQTAVKSQITAFGTLAGRISNLQSSASTLGDLSSINAFAGTSSDGTAVGVSTSDGAQEGHFDVVVNALAKAQVTVSTSSAADSNTTVVASSGTLTIGGVDVTLTGDVTLEGLAAAINNTDDIGVSATVIRTAPNTYRLALASRDTGEANAFTISSSVAGVTFGGNAVDAADADLTINGIPVTSSSNSLENVMPGVTLTVFKAGPDAVHVDVAPDSDTLKNKVEEFITAYNLIVTFVKEQRTASADGDTKSIGQDPLLRQLQTDLRNTMFGTFGSGAVKSLAEVGIEFTRDGTVQLNDTLFKTAVADHPGDIQTMFAGAGGAFTAVDTLLDNYSQANGFVASAKNRLNAQVKRMDDQIVAMQDRLAIQKLALQQEFSAADAAISALNSQRDSLTNFQNNFGSNL